MFPGKPKRSRLLVEAGGSPCSLAQSFQPAAGVWQAGAKGWHGHGGRHPILQQTRPGQGAVRSLRCVCRQVGSGVTRPWHVVVPVWWLSDMPMCSGHLLRGDGEVSVPFLETGPLEDWSSDVAQEGLTALGHRAVGKHRLARGGDHWGGLSTCPGTPPATTTAKAWLQPSSPPPPGHQRVTPRTPESQTMTVVLPRHASWSDLFRGTGERERPRALLLPPTPAGPRNQRFPGRGQPRPSPLAGPAPATPGPLQARRQVPLGGSLLISPCFRRGGALAACAGSENKIKEIGNVS